MRGLFAAVRRNPARVVALVIAVIGVASSFGLGIDDGQRSAIVALVGAVLAVLGGEVTRAQVTPVSELEDPDRDDPAAAQD